MAWKELRHALWALIFSGLFREQKVSKRKEGEEYLTLDLSNHITVVALFECYSEVVDSGILFSLPFFFVAIKYVVV